MKRQGTPGGGPSGTSDARLDRRDFLQRLALLAGAAAIPIPLPACRRSPSPSDAARTFDPHEWAVVEAATSRIIPTDDVPGAREANVVGFIDAQLDDPHFTVFRREFPRGIRVLDRLSRQRRGARFDALAPGDQDAVLAAIGDGEGGGAGIDAAHFFQLLFTLTLEGFLSDPAHGGNADGVGWEVIGYAPSGPHPHHRAGRRHG